MRQKKGITNVEFVLALFVFLSTLSFVTIDVINRIPNIHTESLGDSIKSRSYYVSQLLIFDEGYPPGWTRDNVERVGISSLSYYELSPVKIIELQSLCNDDKVRLRSLLGDIVLNITMRGEPVLYCDTGRPAILFSMKRFAVYNNGVAKIEITAG